MIDREEFDNRFTYHPPADDDVDKYQQIRSCGREFADYIDTLAPDSREKSLAITRVEEAVMWANAAIARHT